MSGARRVVSIANPRRIMGGAAKEVRIVTGGAEGGSAHPVFVITDSDLKANGGRFSLEGGLPELVVVVDTPRYMLNGAAMTVYTAGGWPSADSVPATAILQENGEAILQEDGDYILVE